MRENVLVNSFCRAKFQPSLNLPKVGGMVIHAAEPLLKKRIQSCLHEEKHCQEVGCVGLPLEKSFSLGLQEDRSPENIVTNTLPLKHKKRALPVFCWQDRISSRNLSMSALKIL